MHPKRQKQIQKQRLMRKRRVRAKIHGTAQRPRLAVRRSLKAVHAQLINDGAGTTLAYISSRQVNQDKALQAKAKKLLSESKKGEEFSKNLQTAYAVGLMIAEKAATMKIKRIVFDRGPYKFHGKIRAVAEGVRGGGLKF